MALKRKLADVVRARPRAEYTPADMVRGTRRRKVSRRNPGVTVTLSFAGTPEIDEIVDYWSRTRHESRSAIFRQAILRAHLAWEREEA